MQKWKKIFGIVIVVALLFIIIVSMSIHDSNEDNEEIVSSNKKVNKLGLVITDKEIEEYNEYGDLVSLKSGTDNFKFTYTYDNDKIIEMTGIYNNQPITSSNMKITYNDNGNVNTLVSETPNLYKYSLQYIYDNDNNLQRIECTMTGSLGDIKQINYYYTKQNIKGTDYIIEEIVDMSTQKTKSIIVAKDIEYDMSSKIIGNYFMPIPYIYYSENLTFNNSTVKSYIGSFNFQTFSPVLLKNIIYEQGETFSDNHKYYNEEFQLVLQSGEGFKHFYNYEKIKENEYNVLELLRDMDYNNTDGNGNLLEIYKQRKYKITYGNFEIPDVQIIEEKQIDYSTYNSLVREYEENACKNAVIYGIQLNSWKDSATNVDKSIDKVYEVLNAN